jgi:phosphoglycolate phosphatase
LADGPTPDLLVLLDIDGTLVWRASREHAEAVVAAIQEVHGPLELSPVPAAGLTDRRIVRSLLRAAGLTDAQIDADMEWLLQIAVRQYEARCPADLSEKVLPGIPLLLKDLSAHDEIQLGLVTGNVEQIAHRKLAAAGIARPLLPWVGAYGSDAEDRNDLVPVAQERAAALHGLPGRWPSQRTVIVGDTPHDIACARAVGARVIAVTTGAFPREELAGADIITDDATQLSFELLELLSA